MFKIFFLFYFITIANANSIGEDNFIKLFYYLEEKNITIGNDITIDELYNLIENKEIYLKNGDINKKFISNKLLMIINKKNENFKKIRKKINNNPNHKINKEVKYFLDDNNERIDNTIKNLKQSKEDDFFSDIINFVLNFMKN